jgi:hypothetical protein
MRTVHWRKTFKPELEPWYPRRERLFPLMSEQQYLDEVFNPFRQIMAAEFGERHWKGWDRILLIYSPTTGPDSLLEEWPWGQEAGSLPR